MYLPPAFVADEPGEQLELLRSVGFGHLVAVADGELVSTPLPFLVDDSLSLVRGHLARANAVWRCAPCDALLIVPVTDTYITPSWYPSKVEHGQVVPTWNYEIVHVHGRLAAHDDPVWLRGQVGELTDHHESSRAEPWAVTDAPEVYVDKVIRGIVGVSLAVSRVSAKRKLSQTRPEADVEGVVTGLERDGHRGAADLRRAMQRG